MSRTARLLAVLFAASFAVAEAAEPWSWVWYPGQWRRAPNQYLGRLTFTIEGDVASAHAFFSGDNFTALFLNGERIGGSGDWYTLKPVTIETLRPLLRKGKNVLAAHVRNADYEGGFILKGAILLANGRRISLNSNARWRCADRPVEGWVKVDFDDSKWVASESIGTPPAGPWGAPTMPPSRHALGSLDVGEPDSEKRFSYAGDGKAVTSTLAYADGTRLTDGGRRLAGRESFTIKLDARGYLVLRRRLAAGQSGDVRVAVGGQDAGLWHSAPPPPGRWADAFFVVPHAHTNGKKKATVSLTPTGAGDYVAYRYDFVSTFEWYTLGAAATGSLDREALAKRSRAAPRDAATAFRYALSLEGERRWPQAETAYRRCADLAGESDLGESASRSARLARAMNALGRSRGDASKLFDVGVYLKLNGFHAAASEALRASIDARPTADAYDQLGEAMLYGGRPIEKCIEAWKEGLKRFPPKDTNHWSCIIALRPKPEQEKLVGAQKQKLRMFLDLVHLCSRGRMALDARVLVKPPPPPQLFRNGELDSLINIAGVAAGGGTLGPDVTYGHSGWSGFGFVTGWDVAWHEWIHQLECGLASSQNGQGWPGCHSSTQFGYRPPWQHWYRALMRYYIRPGQYQRACIADHADVPHADKWLVRGPFKSPDVYPRWLCYPGKRAGNKVAWNTRKAFTLADAPTKATIAATGDNWWVAWVNGRRVGTGGSWRHAPRLDITKHLRKGANVIALSALNDDFTGGVLAHAIIAFKGGRRTVLATDESWKTGLSTEKEFRALHAAAAPPAPAWTKSDFDDTAWKLSEVVGRYPCPPWNVIQIDLAGRLMTRDFAGPSAAAPSAADGWKAVALAGKVATLREIAPPPGKTYQTLTYAFTYVRAPADLRAQMSLGASRRTFVTLNGEVVCRHMGRGLPTLPRVFPVSLKKGWNRLLVRAEDIAQKSAFWVKIYRPDGRPIDGLKYSNQKPRAEVVPDQRTLPTFDPARPKRYRWTDVADDPYTLMPQLTAADLAALTGYRKLTLTGGNDFLFVGLNGATVPPGYQPLAAYAGGERSVNNALTWDFEPAAVVRYARAGTTRDLLFVKPDALEAIFQTGLLTTARGTPHPRDALLGWVVAKGRLCVVAECRLGALPRRTMDLLTVR